MHRRLVALSLHPSAFIPQLKPRVFPLGVYKFKQCDAFVKIIVDKVVWRSGFMEGVVQYKVSGFEKEGTYPAWHAEATFRNGKLDDFTREGGGDATKKWFDRIRKAAEVSAAIGIFDPIEEEMGIEEKTPVNQTKTGEWDKAEYEIIEMPIPLF